MDLQVQQNVRQIMQQFSKQQLQKQLEQTRQQGTIHIPQVHVQQSEPSTSLPNVQIQYQPQAKYILNRNVMRLPGTSSGQIVVTSVATTAPQTPPAAPSPNVTTTSS